MEIEAMEEEKRRLEKREEMVEFERLRVEQEKKELRWREREVNRKEWKKLNEIKLKEEIEEMRNRVRGQMGLGEETLMTGGNDSESSLFVELNQQMNRIRDEEEIRFKRGYVLATVDGKASTRGSAKNTPSI